MGFFTGLGTLVGAYFGAPTAGAAIGKGIDEGIANRSSESAGNKNADLQREFAQNGIRWKVADAKAAGIHPVYALGAQGYSASPSYVGGYQAGSDSYLDGQDISRAVHATRTPEERADVLGDFIQQNDKRRDLVRQAAVQESRQSTLYVLDAERKWLENEILRQRLRATQAAGTGPGIPSGAGSGDSPRSPFAPDVYGMIPAKGPSPSSMDPSLEAGPARPGYVPVNIGTSTQPYVVEVPNTPLGGQNMNPVPFMAARGFFNHFYPNPPTDTLRGQRREFVPWYADPEGSVAQKMFRGGSWRNTWKSEAWRSNGRPY